MAKGDKSGTTTDERSDVRMYADIGPDSGKAARAAVDAAAAAVTAAEHGHMLTAGGKVLQTWKQDVYLASDVAREGSADAVASLSAGVKKVEGLFGTSMAPAAPPDPTRPAVTPMETAAKKDASRQL